MTTLQQQPIHTSRGRLDELLTNSNSTCSRCHGLLVKTFCISPDEGIADFQIPVMKCLQCGDLFDTTILENRWRSEHHQLIHHKGARRP
jgi:hypothetical protein